MNKYFGPDGFLFHDSGHFRFEFVVDHGGTPTDPSDDVLIEDHGIVKGSTGRSDDFCETIVPALEA